MAMGVFYIVKAATLPAVVLSVILGIFAGELIYLERGIEIGVGKIRGPLEKMFHVNSENNDDKFIMEFVAAAVLFCASGTGIFGALQAGIAGDHVILITKALLDFFTSVVFAITLGPIVALICVPQCVILLVLFFSSEFIFPLTTEFMRADLTACGGILMLATGLRICDIKPFAIANMLPAMVLVMPISYLWNIFILPLLT
jgi:Uncharacterized membrane protein, possible Na+ channel or pump